MISLSLESDSVFQINSKPSHFMILRIVQSGHVNCPFFEIGHFVLCLRVCVTKGMRYLKTKCKPKRYSMKEGPKERLSV